MKTLLFSLVFLASISFTAQNFESIFSFTSAPYTNEYANAGLELSNGKYLIGINNKLLCLDVNGDSLWSKTYTNFGDITKIFKNNANEIMLATDYGKMRFLKINSTNGDTISSFYVPQQFSNSGYRIYDVVVLPSNDYVIAYVNGSGNGGAVRRFTPGTNIVKWTNDYANIDFGPKALLLDDTTIIITGYKGAANWMFNLYTRKITQSNTTLWSKELKRNAMYKDRTVGIQKNSNNNYFIATSFGINNLLLPSIAVLQGNNGDSLGVKYITSDNGITINHGYLTSLHKSGNTFYASGSLNLNTTTPTNQQIAQGYLSSFKIDNNGDFIGSKSFNKVGTYTISPNNYTSSQAWGNGIFTTNDGYYLTYGVATRVHQMGQNIAPQAQWRGYVIKQNSFNAVGIKELGKNKVNDVFEMYPNPTNNNLFIEFKDITMIKSYTVKVTDVIGKVIFEEKNNQNEIILNVENLHSGIYFVTIINEGKSMTSKFIKN